MGLVSLAGFGNTNPGKIQKYLKIAENSENITRP
jgi:hypothetical protein